MSEFWPGQKVIVLEPDWDEEEDSYLLPEDWAEEMLDFVGQTVTIAHINKHGLIYLEEDDGQWEWADEDFMPAKELSETNPNRSFGELIQERRIIRARNPWKTKSNPCGEVAIQGFVYNSDPDPATIDIGNEGAIVWNSSDEESIPENTPSPAPWSIDLPSEPEDDIPF